MEDKTVENIRNKKYNKKSFEAQDPRRLLRELQAQSKEQ